MHWDDDNNEDEDEDDDNNGDEDGLVETPTLGVHQVPTSAAL